MACAEYMYCILMVNERENMRPLIFIRPPRRPFASPMPRVFGRDVFEMAFSIHGGRARLVSEGAQRGEEEFEFQ